MYPLPGLENFGTKNTMFGKQFDRYFRPPVATVVECFILLQRPAAERTLVHLARLLEWILHKYLTIPRPSTLSFDAWRFFFFGAFSCCSFLFICTPNIKAQWSNFQCAYIVNATL